MTDPHEIIEAALADAHDIGMTDAQYAKAIVRALEAAGYRLLSAEGVTDEMAKPIRDVMQDLYDGSWSDRRRIIGEKKTRIAKSIAAEVISRAPLFGKGSEK